MAMASPVQIVWSFDTTGSMSSCLESVKTQIKDLSQRLLRDIPTLEIGLIAHGDYCDRNSSYLIKTMPFCTDPEEIKKWVSGVGSTGGGDAPEAYEIALRSAVEDFEWKENARKVVALIGDEIPHDAFFPDNTDNVDWNRELDRLAASGIRVFGIQCLDNSRATYFYKALADRTDGLWLPMSDLRIMKDVFLAVCLQVADTQAFDQFRSQLAEGGPVASALVPLMTRLAKKKKLSSEELAALCGVVGKLASEHGQPPKEVFLPIDCVEVSAHVDVGACEVKLAQTFTNNEQVAGKGCSFEYRFALPPSAAVFHFEAHLSSGRIVKGIIKARDEAKKQYDRAISRGEKAFLMEEKHADVFSMELGNLEPNEKVKITLTYVTEVEETNEKSIRLRLPQHVAPRSGGRAVNGMLACYPITVHVSASQASGICRLKSLTHGKNFTTPSDATSAGVSGCLKLKPDDGLLNGDLVFDMEMMNAFANVSINCEYNEEAGSTVVQVAMRPPVPIIDGSSRDRNVKLAIVLDGSCSMQGRAWEQARAAAAAVLSELDKACPEAECTCLLMQHKTNLICDYTVVSEARVIIEAWQGQCGGGTNFESAFDTLSESAQQANVVLFISDGHGPEILQPLFLKAKGAARRIMCLGVGPDPGLELLEGLAAVTGGLSEVASSQSETTCIAGRIASAIVACPIEIKIELPGVAEYEQWPEQCLAYPGHRAVAYLRLCTRIASGVDSISINGEMMSMSSEPTSNGKHLHRLGARNRISELERLNSDGANDHAIRALALANGLTSSMTSFLAVDDHGSASSERSDSIRQDLSTFDEPENYARRCKTECHSRMMELCSDSGGDLMALTQALSSGRECLSDTLTRSACLRPCSTSMYCAAPPPSMGARAAAAVSGMAPGFCSVAKNKEKKIRRSHESESPSGLQRSSIFAAMGSVKSWFGGPTRSGANSNSTRAAMSQRRKDASTLFSWKPASGPLLDASLEEPMHTAALRGCDRYFEGVIQHPTFGPSDIILKLVLDKLGDDGLYVGRWTAMGQTETIVLRLELSTGSVTIEDRGTNCKSKTVLQGTLDFKTGCLSGEVIQEGATGGRFELKPDIGRVELVDTDGDSLVFIRLLGGGVAEYCNSKLEISLLKGLHVNRESGLCNDGYGTFTIPADGLQAKLDELRHLFSKSKTPLTM